MRNDPPILIGDTVGAPLDSGAFVVGAAAGLTDLFPGSPLVTEQQRTLIDLLLEEQQRLTAVERFAKKHEAGALPAQARYYRALLPTSKPGPGEQYAFGVDLDACTGCKACVSACHSLNGLDEDEIWRNVGFIYGGNSADAYQQTVTTACHHCVEPACLEGCPVLAYEKDEETGIVRHLDDQCIGCQYCVLKCPYDVPKYSEKRGIVRKCDMCTGRLSEGEAPMCVQACPTGAISIRLVNKAELVAQIHSGDALLPGAFDSSYTKPTTLYRTNRKMPANAGPADAGALRLEHAHWPLIWMLTLSQLGTGLFAALALFSPASAVLPLVDERALAATGFLALHAGLAASVFHLGRPLGAWRAFLGLRRSWMSREIVVFGAFSMASTGLLASVFAGELDRFGGIAKTAGVLLTILSLPLRWVTLGTALLGVFCSAMIYIDTRRPTWRAEVVIPKFFGTALLLGLSAAACVLGFVGAASAVVNALLLCSVAFHLILLGWEARAFFEAMTKPSAPGHRSVRALWELRRMAVLGRPACFLAALASAIAAIAWGGFAGALAAAASFLFTLGAQVIERYCFFAGGEAPRMPGGIDPGGLH